MPSRTDVAHGTPEPASPAAGWEPAALQQMPTVAWPIQSLLARFLTTDEWPSPSALTEVLGTAMSFVPAPPKPRRRRRPQTLEERTAYDRSIVSRGEVPTRERNWHDFFNALVWAVFPASKAAIHRRQLALLMDAGDDETDTARRAPEHDRLAMIDEGGVIVLSTRRTTDYRSLTDLELSGQTCRVLFGHALYEHLHTAPKGAIAWACGFVVEVPSIPDSPAGVVHAADSALASLVASRAYEEQETHRISIP